LVSEEAIDLDSIRMTGRLRHQLYKGLRRNLQRLFKAVAPRTYWRIKLDRLSRHDLEREADLLPLLVSPGRVSIDVGAANGDYVARLVHLSSKVVAFEPRVAEAAALREMARALALPIQVECLALSDSNGSTRFRILTGDAGRSTIEPGNPLDDPDGGKVRTVTAETRRLDDMGISNIEFMKIDVEGHEMAVLRGAKETIENARCCLLIEAEDRHADGSPTQVMGWMRNLGYAGYFLLDDRLVETERFDPRTHQQADKVGGRRLRRKSHDTYVNNFIFVPMEKKDAFLRGSAELGFRV
jgi:FkbM family methyltransferase